MFSCIFIPFQMLHAPIRQMDNSEIFDQTLFFLYCSTNVMLINEQPPQISLIYWRNSLCWTYLAEKFCINRVYELNTRAAVSGIYIQYSWKCPDSPAEVIRFYCPLGFYLCIMFVQIYKSCLSLGGKHVKTIYTIYIIYTI